MKRLFTKTSKLMHEARNILIVSHRKPDADTLGTALCLDFMLKRNGKKTTLACVDKPSNAFSFLPGVDQFVQEFDISDYDLMIIVDSGASYMTNFHLKYDNFYSSGIPIINIDHHASNDNYGTVNIVDPESASTTVILYNMLKLWGEEIDKNMATCLVAGIYGDTGSFMHANTDKEVFEISADLLNRGAEFDKITKSLFNTNTVTSLKLWGSVLEQVSITDDNVVMSVVREQDYDKVGASPDHLSGVIDYLNMVPDSKFAVLINEDRNGNVKGSFRTRNDAVDLSRIAAVFGGGGHPKASGFCVKGKLQESKHFNIVNDDEEKKFLEF